MRAQRTHGGRETQLPPRRPEVNPPCSVANGGFSSLSAHPPFSLFTSFFIGRRSLRLAVCRRYRRCKSDPGSIRNGSSVSVVSDRPARLPLDGNGSQITGLWVHHLAIDRSHRVNDHRIYAYLSLCGRVLPNDVESI